jgi:hypothetical protein
MPKEIFSGLAHVAVFTANYEESLRFYTKVLPFKLVKELDENKPEDRSGFFPIKYALVKLGDLYIEIVAPADSRKAPAAGVFDHIGIRVSSVDEAVASLIKRGAPAGSIAPVIVNTSLYPGKTFRVSSIIGPDGEKVGLYELDNEEFFGEK